MPFFLRFLLLQAITENLSVSKLKTHLANVSLSALNVQNSNVPLLLLPTTLILYFVFIYNLYSYAKILKKYGIKKSLTKINRIFITIINLDNDIFKRI